MGLEKNRILIILDLNIFFNLIIVGEKNGPVNIKSYIKPNFKSGL